MINMWQWNNVKFRYANPVDGTFGEETTIPKLFTYVKSKYALIEALQIHVSNSYLDRYTEIDIRSVKYNKPVRPN